MDEQEVERQVQLVLAAAVVRDQRVEVEHVGLPDEDPPRRRRASAEPRQRRSTSCTSGRFIENTCLTARRRTSGWSSGVTAGSSRSSRSLTIAWQTSIRKPAMPRSNQKRRMSSNAPRTSSFHQLRSGWRRQEVLEEVLAGRLVQLPRGAAEVRLPVVRRPAAGRRVRPHVVVAVARVAARERVLEPRRGGRSCGSGRGRAARGSRARRAAATSASRSSSVPSSGCTAV